MSTHQRLIFSIWRYLENSNAIFIDEGMEQAERLVRLNQIAIQQMTILLEDKNIGLLGLEESM